MQADDARILVLPWDFGTDRRLWHREHGWIWVAEDIDPDGRDLIEPESMHVQHRGFVPSPDGKSVALNLDCARCGHVDGKLWTREQWETRALAALNDATDPRVVVLDVSYMR